jgi:3-methyl-2-oxobutanoate hydroxymethyltransferase
LHDILGLFEDFVPKHTHRYANLAQTMGTAIAAYKTEVEQHLFPTPAHAPSIEPTLLAHLPPAAPPPDGEDA